MKKLAILTLALVGALVAAAPAMAQEAGPAPGLIAEGVTVGAVSVGGMTAEQARAAIQTSFDVPLTFTFKKRVWKATPRQLGASPRVEAALAHALVAPPGSHVELLTKIKGKQVRRYAAYLDRVFSRPVRDTRVRVIKSKPRYSKPRSGVVVDRSANVEAILAALNGHQRTPIPLVASLIEPSVTPANFGPVVVIKRESKQLHFYKGRKLVRKFGVATGLPQYPTPIGSFSIIDMQRDPAWYPPDSDWARGAEPIPPGPGNPLGTRWMGISSPLIGIHGTPDATSIGYSASHGCIRMQIHEAEWLFENVDLGTPIFITRH